MKEGRKEGGAGASGGRSKHHPLCRNKLLSCGPKVCGVLWVAVSTCNCIALVLVLLVLGQGLSRRTFKMGGVSTPLHTTQILRNIQQIMDKTGGPAETTGPHHIHFRNRLINQLQGHNFHIWSIRTK